jgi:hypothetical protein
MPITIPTAPFSAAQTIFGAKVIAVITPTGGSAFNVAAKVLDFAYKTTPVERSIPGTDYLIRPDRQTVKEAREEFTLTDIEEIDQFITNMGSFTGINKMGVCVLWIIDQNDPTGTSVRLKSNSFAMSIKVKDGTTKFGGGDFAKASYTILSLSPAGIVWTPNATS